MSNERVPSILVVEDNPTLRMTLVLLLNRLGYESDSAANGIEAVRRVKNWQYKTVLMDIQMPEMDGLEATCAIRVYEHSHGLEPVPIIAVTGDGDRNICMTCGMNDFMRKPICKDDLTKMLEKHCSKM
ncbi:MAG TPA: response regulator [Oculatellaceae cyanobacterium]